MKDVNGKVAFVTGAANGIGLAICRALARAGAQVALADIQPDALESARQEIAALGVNTIALSLDYLMPTRWHVQLMKWKRHSAKCTSFATTPVSQLSTVCCNSHPPSGTGFSA